jgi:tetratricopeptide (TPR) repeat protein
LRSNAAGPNSADLVDIVRDFIAAHRTTKRLFERFRAGELRFAELGELIGDDEASVLFRLKERCHALFRPRDASAAIASRGEALFDLAVGSLFHEAMKFRENFYQQEIYGPRVRALASGETREDDVLFREFEKLLSVVSERLAEGLQETEILIEQSIKQLRTLLRENPNDGLVLRCLLENQTRTEDVFADAIDDVFAEIEGSAAAGYDLVGRSYLASGFYREAEKAFVLAIDRGGDAGDLVGLVRFARGMGAYLDREYEVCLTQIGASLDGGEGVGDPLLDIARRAISSIDQLVDDEGRERIGAAAAALLERIGPGDTLEAHDA